MDEKKIILKGKEAKSLAKYLAAKPEMAATFCEQNGVGIEALEADAELQGKLLFAYMEAEGNQSVPDTPDPYAQEVDRAIAKGWLKVADRDKAQAAIKTDREVYDTFLNIPKVEKKK